MSLPIEILYALSGLCVGFIVGMTGVGGGSLMTPLLILLFGIHPATAWRNCAEIDMASTVSASMTNIASVLCGEDTTRSR